MASLLPLNRYLVQGNQSLNHTSWSPDGSTIVTTYAQKLTLFNSYQPSGELVPYLVQDTFQPITSLLWYNYMNCFDLVSNCFLLSSPNFPVKLLDGIDLKVRSSYSVIDSSERYVAPIGLTFDPTGTHFYAGYYNHIQKFNLNQPTRPMLTLSTCQGRKVKGGVKGLVSCLQFPSVDENILSCATYNGNFGLIDQRQPIQFNLNCSLKLKSSVVQTKYYDQHRVLFNLRRCKFTPIYDLRFTNQPVTQFQRENFTDQKLMLDFYQQFCLFGDTKGFLNVVDLTDGSLKTKFKVSQAPVNCVAYNATNHMVLVTSGARSSSNNLILDSSLQLYSIQDLINF